MYFEHELKRIPALCSLKSFLLLLLRPHYKNFNKKVMLGRRFCNVGFYLYLLLNHVFMLFQLRAILIYQPSQIFHAI